MKQFKRSIIQYTTENQRHLITITEVFNKVKSEDVTEYYHDDSETRFIISSCERIIGKNANENTYYKLKDYYLAQENAKLLINIE